MPRIVRTVRGILSEVVGKADAKVDLVSVLHDRAVRGITYDVFERIEPRSVAMGSLESRAAADSASQSDAPLTPGWLRREALL